MAPMGISVTLDKIARILKHTW